ncbi:hypothetical protein ZWY2020_021374 [Hordeum vulgare]|nr:hypothetical protein ZWY2020_021374 [Hordeum vulgare]
MKTARPPSLVDDDGSRHLVLRRVSRTARPQLSSWFPLSPTRLNSAAPASRSNSEVYPHLTGGARCRLTDRTVLPRRGTCALETSIIPHHELSDSAAERASLWPGRIGRVYGVDRVQALAAAINGLAPRCRLCAPTENDGHHTPYASCSYGSTYVLFLLSTSRI